MNYWINKIVRSTPYLIKRDGKLSYLRGTLGFTRFNVYGNTNITRFIDITISSDPLFRE